MTTVSAPVPEVIVLKPPLPNSVAAPAPEFTIVSLPPPPMKVSMFDTVTHVESPVERQLVGSGAEIDDAVIDRSRNGDGVGAGAAGDGLDVGDGAGVGDVGRASGVSSPAPRSSVMPVERRGQGDGVGAGAAGERLDIGDGGRVGEVAEGQRCRCRRRD